MPTAVPAYLVVIARLLEGSEDEVTAHVRRSAYDALCRVIKHHDPRSATHGLEDAGNVILRGISDKERSVRLSAGYVYYQPDPLHIF